MSLDTVHEAISRHLGYLLNLDNVVGVGVGRKEVSGRATGELAVTVLVRKKIQARELTTSQMIPKSLGRDAKTDVIEVGDLRLYDTEPERTSRLRPAPCGVSVGHYTVSAGTLGALIRDRATGKVLILGNNHVLANNTDGRDDRAAVGDPIVQPGLHDGGTVEQDTIAYLDRFEPLYRAASKSACPFAQGAERWGNMMLRRIAGAYELRLLRKGAINHVDAAAARPISEDMVTPDIIGIGRAVGPTAAQPGMPVIKSGRSSGLTTGEIRIVEATIKVMLSEGEVATFTDQILTTPMAQPGDSGSLGLTEDRQAFGLLCAGSQSSTMFCRLDTVLELFNCDLVS